MQALTFSVVIPARLQSTRLPRKVLADLGGKPMIVRVAEQAQRSSAAEVIVAADDAEIITTCEQFGVRAQWTRPDHRSGTERLAEIVEQNQYAPDHIVVNVQGDEPFISPDAIDLVAKTLAQSNEQVVMSTLAHPIETLEEFLNPNVVKVVLSNTNLAHYFSRAPIPYPRDAFNGQKQLPDSFGALRHLGIYAYRAQFLRTYAQLAPSPLEAFESLEQLRVLWHDYLISVATLDAPLGLGVDTPEDLEQARRLLSSSIKGEQL